MSTIPVLLSFPPPNCPNALCQSHSVGLVLRFSLLIMNEEDNSSMALRLPHTFMDAMMVSTKAIIFTHGQSVETA